MGVNLGQLIVGPLRVGIRNDGVRMVQERLNEVLAGTPGYLRLSTDGAFGGRTQAAVLQFQKLRQLRADGVVGPVTAKALGFTQYTSLQRLGAGAMQLASVIGGSLARMVPAPRAEPDLAYSMLTALAVQADAMRMVVGAIPGAANAKHELERIVASLKQQLAGAAAQQYVLPIDIVQAFNQANALQARLLALSRQLQALARAQGAKPGSPEAALLDMLLLQSRMLAAHAQAVVGLQVMNSVQALQRQADAADEVLKIAAAVVRAANQLVPRL